jgi:site-specific recombinase XerD
MDAIAGFTLDQRRRGLAINTTRARERALRLFERDLGLDATREQIEDWLDGRNLCAKSRAVMLSHLGCFYTWRGGENPVAQIRPPKLHRGLPRPIPDKDLTRALAKATPLLRAWLLLGALEGLRCQEIAGLAREDLSESEGLLRVVEAKGGNERMVPLHAKVLEALKAYGMPERGPLFLNRFHQRVSPGDVSHQLGDYLRSLGIASTPHSLRHAFATAVYRSSLDLLLTQSLLGHRSPTSTVVYASADMGKAAGIVGAISV